MKAIDIGGVQEDLRRINWILRRMVEEEGHSVPSGALEQRHRDRKA